MYGHLPHLALPVATLALAFAPSIADAAPSAGKAAARTARVVKAHACTRPPVQVTSGAESATFALADCSGNATPSAVEQLSVLARPAGIPKPKEHVSAGTKGANGRTSELVRGVRRVDPRLLERLELVVEHFRKAGEAAHIALVSGYRPRAAGSYHSTGRALDFRLDNVTNEALVAFCKTLTDTGCGYYPNSLFVHMDVRDRGAGHVAWIDASRPGEPPHYVTSWPPQGATAEAADLKLPALPVDDHSDAIEQDPPRTKAGGPLFF